MKKLEIIEYPSPSPFLYGEISLGDVFNADNPKDIFGVVSFGILDEKEIPTGLKDGIWEHFKPGKAYKIIGITYREKTKQYLVIYESLYDSKDYPKGTLWGRPIEEFLGYKEKDGKKIKRFTFLNRGEL